MPPLKAAPEIIHATSEDELQSELQRFRQGDTAYIPVRGTETMRLYHTFAPVGTEPSMSAMGLMMDGNVEPMYGEYFEDVATFEEMGGRLDNLHFDSRFANRVGVMNGPESIQTKHNFFSRLMKRVMN